MSNREYLKTKLRNMLDDNQSNKSDRLLVVKQIPFGLGGQYTTRLCAFKIGLALNRKVIFQYEGDPPYSLTFNLKKNDIGFDWSTISSFDKVNPMLDQGDPCLVFDPKEWDEEYDSFLVKKIFDGFGLKSSDISDSISVVNAIIFNWMPVRDDFLERYAEDIKRLKITDKTLCVHFRRGDKTAEMPYVPAKVYSECIVSMLDELGLDNVFVASDNPQAISELKLPSTVQVIFDSSELRYNNANHRMLLKDPMLSEQETYTVYKNIRLLSEGGGCLGQDNAHFATIAADLLTFSKSSTHVKILPGDYALRNSKVNIALYSFKKSIRDILRVLFPFMTAERMSKK